MGYASQAGRARTNPRRPEAHAICDRCGFRFNRTDLRWQMDWRGAAIQNLRILVCARCTDTPQAQLRAISLPPDPTPVPNARPENFIGDEVDYRYTSAPALTDPVTGLPVPQGQQRGTINGQTRQVQAIGVPDDIDAAAVPPLAGKVAYGVQLPVLSVVASGSVVTVSCSGPHGLGTGQQVVTEGLSAAAANGLFAVIPSTATVFTFQVDGDLPSGSLLTGHFRIITANVGMPLDYAQTNLDGGAGFGEFAFGVSSF